MRTSGWIIWWAVLVAINVCIWMSVRHSKRARRRPGYDFEGWSHDITAAGRWLSLAFPLTAFMAITLLWAQFHG